LDLKNVAQVKKDFQASDRKCQKMLDVIRLLDNKIRFRILYLLKDGKYCVSEIVEIIQAGKVSNVSQQLSSLTNAKLIKQRRSGKRIYYTLRDNRIARLIGFLEANFLPKK